MEHQIQGKRGRLLIPNDYITKDLYKFYKKSSKNPVSYKKYQEFLFNNGLIKKLTNEILYKAYILHLPWGGNLMVHKYKPKVRFKPDGSLDYERSHIKVDWKATKELWKNDPEAYAKKTIVTHYNKHSRGYLVKFHWSKKNMGAVKNKVFYKFNPVRKLDRELAAVVKSDRFGRDIDFYTR